MPTKKDPASPLAFGIASALNDAKLEGVYRTGTEAAERSGLTASQISRWENAVVDITVNDLWTLCAGLGLDPHKFLEAARKRASEYELRTSVAESTSPE